jgi:hypothetical protein
MIFPWVRIPILTRVHESGSESNPLPCSFRPVKPFADQLGHKSERSEPTLWRMHHASV